MNFLRSLQILGEFGVVDQLPHQESLALGRLLLINPGPLHPQLLHIRQQQILLVINVPLPTLLNSLHQSHPHHVHSELRLRTHCQNTLIHILQSQSLNPLHYCLQLVEVLGVADPVHLSQDDLYVYIVLVSPLQKLHIAVLQSVFKVNAQEDLRQSRGHLHVLVGESEPQFPSLLVHPREAIPRSIHHKTVLITYMMEMQKLGGACALGHAGHLLPTLLAGSVEDLVDEGGLARVGSAHEKYLFFLEEGGLVVLDLPLQKFRQGGVVDLMQIGTVDLQ